MRRLVDVLGGTFDALGERLPGFLFGGDRQLIFDLLLLLLDHLDRGGRRGRARVVGYQWRRVDGGCGRRRRCLLKLLLHLLLLLLLLGLNLLLHLLLYLLLNLLDLLLLHLLLLLLLLLLHLLLVMTDGGGLLLLLMSSLVLLVYHGCRRCRARVADVVDVDVVVITSVSVVIYNYSLLLFRLLWFDLVASSPLVRSEQSHGTGRG